MPPKYGCHFERSNSRSTPTTTRPDFFARREDLSDGTLGAVCSKRFPMYNRLDMNQARFIWAPLLMFTSYASAEPHPTFEGSVRPFLVQTCYACHSTKLNTSGLNLETYSTPDSILKDRVKCELVLNTLRSRQMPTRSVPRPSETCVKIVEKWIQVEFNRA